MMRKEGFLLDLDYKTEDGFSYLRFFVEEDGEIKLYHYRKFLPYFYILVEKEKKEEIKRRLKEKKFGEKKDASIYSIEELKEDGGKAVLKLYFRSTIDLKKVREEIKSVEGVLEKREYDIPFVDRFMIDKNISLFRKIEFEEEKGEIKEFSLKEEKIKIRTAAFDIETYSREDFSNPEKDPILSISYIEGNYKKIITTKNPPTKKDYIKVVKSEKEMILEFIKTIEERKPHIIYTYNGDSFDWEYIKIRGKKYGIELRICYDKSVISKKGGQHPSFKGKGFHHVDVYKVVRFLSGIGVIDLDRYTLESVYLGVFGKEKIKLYGKNINESWESGEIDILLEYNLQDSKATLEIGDYYLPLFVELGEILNERIEDVSRESTGMMVERLLIKKCKEKGILARNRPKEEEVRYRSSFSYEGAIVIEPKKGIHENIVVFDFRSLYPSIIITHNVSPEVLNIPCSNYDISPLGHKFCKEKKGFIPETLEKIFYERIEYKRKYKEEKDEEKKKKFFIRQWALKILLNSFYGYMGYVRARWYSLECASSITAWARNYIKKTCEILEKKGYEILYGDTDSVFFKLKEGEGKERIFELLEEINESFPGIIELEFDGFYKRGIFVEKKVGGMAKKRYALLKENGELKIVGFEYVRRDWSVLAREVQKRVLEYLLKEGDVEKAKNYVKEVIKKLKEGKMEKEKLIIHTQIRKDLSSYESTGPHVEAAKKAIRRGKKIGVGGIVEYIITRRGRSISEKAELAEFVEEGNYDVDYYINNQVLPAVEKIFRSVGINKEEILGEGKQTTLFGWG